jgi:hypothetical protein
MMQQAAQAQDAGVVDQLLQEAMILLGSWPGRTKGEDLKSDMLVARRLRQAAGELHDKIVEYRRAQRGMHDQEEVSVHQGCMNIETRRAASLLVVARKRAARAASELR